MFEEICILDIMPTIDHIISVEGYLMMADAGDVVQLHIGIHPVAAHNCHFFTFCA